MAGGARPSEVVRIPRAVMSAICEHAASAAPAECCGLLVGRPGEIDDAVRTRNQAERPTRFVVHPEDHVAAIRAARARGAAVVGAYHSHPSSAPVPSPTDLAEADDPTLLHVIVSLRSGPAAPEVRAFRLHDGNFDEIGLVPVG